MNNLVIKRSQQIQFVLAGSVAVGRRYFATDIPNLSRNNVVVYGIEFSPLHSKLLLQLV